jgi:hypothetical protein
VERREDAPEPWPKEEGPLNHEYDDSGECMMCGHQALDDDEGLDCPGPSYSTLRTTVERQAAELQSLRGRVETGQRIIHQQNVERQEIIDENRRNSDAQETELSSLRGRIATQVETWEHDLQTGRWVTRHNPEGYKEWLEKARENGRPCMPDCKKCAVLATLGEAAGPSKKKNKKHESEAPLTRSTEELLDKQDRELRKLANRGGE